MTTKAELVELIEDAYEGFHNNNRVTTPWFNFLADRLISAGVVGEGRGDWSDADVERVARAICDAEWEGSQPWDHKPKSFQDRYRSYAGAALATITPTVAQGAGIGAAVFERVVKDTQTIKQVSSHSIIAPAHPLAPGGFVLVPIEPTEETAERVGRRICALEGKNPDRDWREIDQPNGSQVDLMVADPEPLNWQHEWRKFYRYYQTMIAARPQAGEE